MLFWNIHDNLWVRKRNMQVTSEIYFLIHSRSWALSDFMFTGFRYTLKIFPVFRGLDQTSLWWNIPTGRESNKDGWYVEELFWSIWAVRVLKGALRRWSGGWFRSFQRQKLSRPLSDWLLVNKREKQKRVLKVADITNPEECKAPRIWPPDGDLLTARPRLDSDNTPTHTGSDCTGGNVDWNQTHVLYTPNMFDWLNHRHLSINCIKNPLKNSSFCFFLTWYLE